MSPWQNETQCIEGDLCVNSNDSKEALSMADMVGVCAWEVLHTVVMNNHNCCWMQ